MQYLKRNSINTQNLLPIETGFVNHSDGWAMRPCPARIEARKRLGELLQD
jgi:hypothetical protein